MENANGRRDELEPPSPVPLWLNGKQIVTGTTFSVSSPTTGHNIWEVSSADEHDAVRAVEAAAGAFRTWHRTKAAERRAIFLRAHELLIEQEERSKYISHRETAAPDGQNSFEYGLAKDLCIHMASLAGSIMGSVPETRDTDRSAIVLREPYGVVLGIAPWNAPHILGLRACITPLVAGNTVVLKGSEFAPATVWHFVSVLHQAGLPPGCLNTIYHRQADAARITERLVSHALVRKVSFTGSTLVGSIIASLCGKNLKPCVMELGGKAPAIVCEDADLQLAARECTIGAFLHAGQICMSTERIVVNRKVAEEFEREMCQAVEVIFGTSTPPQMLVQERIVEKNKDLVQDAVAKGARVIYGDPSSKERLATAMRPLIVSGVTTNMDIYHTESFGPTVSIIVVASDEEALSTANDTEYGLSASVFTADLGRGLKLARAIDAGAVHINSMSVHDESLLPHGGWKKSGFGRNNGTDGLLEWVQTKAITWKD